MDFTRAELQDVVEARNSRLTPAIPLWTVESAGLEQKETGQPKPPCMLNLQKSLCGRRFARRDARRSARLRLQDLLHAVAITLLRDDTGGKLLAFKDKLQLVGVQHFALEQGQSYADHGI